MKSPVGTTGIYREIAQYSAIENSRATARSQDHFSCLFSRPYGTFQPCVLTQDCVLG